MKVYALKNLNSPFSSSGGAFPAIVDAYWKAIGSKNLYIYGAAFVERFNVKHIRVKYDDGIQPLLESKYVQSDMSNVYDGLHDDLLNGRYVIFIGTPCQVYAINKYVERMNLERNTLLTIDLVCHGTPSNIFWRKYVDLIFKHTKEKIDEIHFRYKKIDGSEKSGLAYVLTDGRIDYAPEDLYVYMRLFSRNLILNKACFNCRHRNKELIRPSDFTIGDFWGVSEIIDEYKNTKGVSLVLVNTLKAEQLIYIMQSDTSGRLHLKECVSEDWLEYNPNVNIKTKCPVKYEFFWNDYQMMDFAELIEKYKREPIRQRIKVYLSALADLLGIKWKLKKIIKICKNMIIQRGE